ncbi:MAG: hypothetical protein LQ346_002916 [Caloplaca aetnensis]|nr:MAG: hypothetical protein LQ346_002916 [Caloplaca aetnensis]
MDHIPLPHYASPNPIQVPYLDLTPDDKGSWRTYPERYGWQVNDVKDTTHILRDGEKRPVSELMALAQSWLYFAFLREILGDTINSHQFAQMEPDGKRRLKAATLEDMLAGWTASFSDNARVSDTNIALDELYGLLIDHRYIGLRLCDSNMGLGNSSVMLSVAALSERLMAAIIDVYHHAGLGAPVEQTWRLRSEVIMDVGQPLLSLMRARGWCSYDIRKLDVETREVSILYYYSNLLPPRSSKDHSGCSEDQCLAMTTNPSTYRLSHRHEGCSCSSLFADQTLVAQILAQGSIPLISVTQNPVTGTSELEVGDAAQGQDFAAISHVWAEGSGNVTDNALKTCLLEDISELVGKLPWDVEQRDPIFWIDTLCVPVRPRELQTLALNKMRVPYERARHVLVLDAHLRSLDSRKLTPTELLAQISCSSWMRRLWTLQEGRLAAKVWFQFADQAVDIQSIWQSLDHRPVPSRAEYWIQLTLYAHLWSQIWYRGEAIGDISGVASTIRMTHNALASRSVSVPTDEALCLFNVMDLDIMQVTAVHPAQRMEVFWRSFQRVPRGLLFSRASSKMSVRGLHWAPSSFMGNQTWKEWAGKQDLNTPKENDAHAIPTNVGLRVQLPGFIFHEELTERMKELDSTWNEPLVFQGKEGEWYAIYANQPWRQGSAISDAPQQLAVILANELKRVDTQSLFSGPFSTSHSPQKFSDGVLVTFVKTEDDILYVSARNHVVVHRLAVDLEGYFNSTYLCAEEVNVQLSTLRSENHAQLKARYETAARQRLDDKDLLELLGGLALSLGEKDDYEYILDDFLKTTVVVARFGDCIKVKKLPGHQQWCVD